MKTVMIRYSDQADFWEYASKVIIQVGVATVILFAVLGFVVPLMIGQPLSYAVFACAKSAGLAMAAVGLTMIYLYRGVMQGFVDCIRHYSNERGYTPAVPSFANVLYLDPGRELSWKRKTAGVLLLGLLLLPLLAGSWRNISLVIVMATLYSSLLRVNWFGIVCMVPLSLILAAFGLNPFLVSGWQFSGWQMGEWILVFPGGALMFVICLLPQYRLTPGDEDQDERKVAPYTYLDHGALFGSLLKQQVIKVSAGVQSSDELYGTGSHEADMPVTGEIDRGQTADSDALAKKLEEMED